MVEGQSHLIRKIRSLFCFGIAISISFSTTFLYGDERYEISGGDVRFCMDHTSFKSLQGDKKTYVEFYFTLSRDQLTFTEMETGYGGAYEIEMILDRERVVGQLAHLFRRGGRFHFPEVVETLGGGHVVGRGANPADPGSDARQFLSRPPDTELFESPEFGNLEERPFHLSGIVQVNIYLAVALKTCNRIYRYFLAHLNSTCV